MKPSKDRTGCDGADALYRPMNGSIKAQCGRLVVEMPSKPTTQLANKAMKVSKFSGGKTHVED